MQMLENLGTTTIRYRLRDRGISNATIADRLGLVIGKNHPSCFFYAKGFFRKEVIAVRMTPTELNICYGHRETEKMAGSIADLAE